VRAVATSGDALARRALRSARCDVPGRCDTFGAMPRTARHPRQVNRVREDILDAAVAVFAGKGYQAATMQDLATAAGYTAPSLYNYFPGKRELFEAMVDRLDAEFMAVFDAATPSRLSFAQQVELLVHRQLEVARRRRGAFKIFSALQAGAIPGAAAGRHAAGFRVYMARFTAWMAAAADGHDLGGRTPEQLAFALWGLSNALQAQRASAARGTRKARDGADDDVEALVEMFLHGALGPSAARRRGGAAG
jgi:AcrR family transcriptional regulator